MSLYKKPLVKLLRQIAETNEIGGKWFESRFEYVKSSDAEFFFPVEKSEPHLLERDRLLLLGRSLTLLRFEVQQRDDHDDFFGGVVALTPHGFDYLEKNSQTWWRMQLNALGQNIVTIGVSALTALVIAWLLDKAGPTP